MILGQLRIGARATTYAALGPTFSKDEIKWCDEEEDRVDDDGEYKDH